MPNNSHYLKPSRLGDVLTALQFLGQYEEYKRSVEEWDKKIATPPQSAGPQSEGGEASWRTIFYEHPEFFRISDDGLISLVWRRALKKTEVGQRPVLDPSTIAKLMDTAIQLHTAAVNAAKEEESARRLLRQDRQWRLQLSVSILTAVLAAIAVVFSAYLKSSTGGT